MNKTKKNRKKRIVLQFLEYGVVSALLFFSRITPLTVIHTLSRLLGNIFYGVVKKRRVIATDNVRHAFAGEKSEQEIQAIVRTSFTSFFLTFLEIAKFRYIYRKPGALDDLRRSSPGLDEVLLKVKQIHDESKGCLFVTPHIGNWELLPHVSTRLGIPLVVVVRPLDNRYLERLIFADRAESGQLIIPKKNALFILQKTLQQGKSIGMLPDQSTMQGVSVDFFGRKATTTPVPAILSIMYKRPIVIVACCRAREGRGFEGFVSDPIWPAPYESEKQEILRLSQEMNREMEKVVRRYPGQYLWMHNRWKSYKGRKEFLS